MEQLKQIVIQQIGRTLADGKKGEKDGEKFINFA